MKETRKLINFRTPEALDEALATSAANRGITKTALLNHLIYDFCNRDVPKQAERIQHAPSSTRHSPHTTTAAHRAPFEYDPFKL